VGSFSFPFAVSAVDSLIERDERLMTGILLKVVRRVIEMFRLQRPIGEEAGKYILALGRDACGGRIVCALRGQSTGGYASGVNQSRSECESQFGSQISATRTNLHLAVGLGGPVNSMV